MQHWYYLNKEDILWQSKIFDEPNYIYKEYDQHIVKFENINVKLQNDKTYLMRIDIVEGRAYCNQVRRGYKDRSKKYFVDSNGRLYHNKYSMRENYRDGKLYEIVFV